jgi:small subunit ribosomal protein S1
MAELLEESSSIRSLRRGDLVGGVIARADADGILVSVGNKSEGLVPQREMRTLTDHDMANYSVGANVLVFVIDPAANEGQALLSIDKAREETSWRVLEEQEGPGTIVTARIIGQNRGGAVVSVGGLQAFVPLSQLIHGTVDNGDDPLSWLSSRVGEEIQVKVLEVDRGRNRVVLSELAALRDQKEDGKDNLLATLKDGDIRTGKVTGIAGFGAFVDIGGADGLIHISELSWNQVGSVGEVVKVGQELSVFVLRIDRDKRRIALSLRRLTPTPWDSASERFELGQLVKAKITRLADFGAFALVENTVEGLVHISEISDRQIQHPKEALHVGDEVTLRITSLDLERRRLGLSLRRVDEQYDNEPEVENV